MRMASFRNLIVKHGSNYNQVLLLKLNLFSRVEMFQMTENNKHLQFLHACKLLMFINCTKNVEAIMSSAVSCTCWVHVLK